MTDKFCINCEHFRSFSGRCMRRVESSIDPVYVSRLIIRGGLIPRDVDAGKERAPLYKRSWLERLFGLEDSLHDRLMHPEKYSDDRCGPEGKYYEPKERPAPPKPINVKATAITKDAA